jgi:hypothetical protein
MKENAKNVWLSDYMLIGYIAFFTFLLHLVAIEGFGYFRDELYYISCTEHLDWGYVDQPPLAILLLKVIRFILGDSLFALRLLPIFGSGLFVFGTGYLAKELGGKKFALIIASLSALAPIGNFFLYSVYSMNFLDHLFWLACIILVLRIIKTGEPKYWITFGIIAGLGLQNKISVLFLCFGIAAGILLTGQRKHLKSKFLWLGAVLAGAIFLPYILWNMAHGWPTLEFMHNAKAYKMTAVSPVEFLLEQLRYNNFATLPIWLAGLWFFFFNHEGKKYRLFGWMYVAIYLLFTIQQAKAYYLAPAYPILFAGGAVMVEAWIRKLNWNWTKPVIAVAILIPTLLYCPVGLAILPLQTTIQWLQTLGITPNSGENHQMGVLPQHFADMHGWEEMTVKVARVYNTLSPEEQKECYIYGTNYGVAGAMNFMGKKYNLPPAISGHNNHFFWPPKGDRGGNVLIFVGGRKQDLLKIFNEVTEMDRTDCRYAMPYENDKPIYLCRGMKLPLAQIWPNAKHFD